VSGENTPLVRGLRRLWSYEALWPESRSCCNGLVLLLRVALSLPPRSQRKPTTGSAELVVLAPDRLDHPLASEAVLPLIHVGPRRRSRSRSAPERPPAGPPARRPRARPRRRRRSARGRGSGRPGA